ncbi:MAG TPA: hypothetical protein VF700_08175 [Segetibacter sp.]
MPLKLIGAFSILVLMGMLVSNTGIDKSFAKEKVALLPLTSPDAELNDNVAQFFSCIEKSIKGSETDKEPRYFNDEPTKTEVALCYNDVFGSPK